MPIVTVLVLLVVLIVLMMKAELSIMVLFVVNPAWCTMMVTVAFILMTVLVMMLVVV